MVAPPRAGEAAEDYLGVAAVAATPGSSRRSSASAWEDGTPLRPRTRARREWPAAQAPVSAVPDDVDAVALLTQAPEPTPAPELASDPTAGVPARPSLLVRRIGAAGTILCGAAVLASVVAAVGTVVLPPLGAVAAVTGLVLRARAGAR